MRSRRKKQNAISAAEEWIKSNMGDPPGFSVKPVSPLIGRGLFAERKFFAGQFLIEYRGVLTNASEYEETADSDLTYVYYFEHGRKELCVDATSSKSFGKYANDEWRNPNAKVQKIIMDGKPHLIIVARRDINPEEEIRYDYGKRDAQWRKKGFQDNDSDLSDSAIVSNALYAVKENKTNGFTGIVSAAGDMPMESSQSTTSLDEEIMPSDIPSENAPLVCPSVSNTPPTSCDVTIVDKLMTGYDTSTATDMMDNGPSMAMDTGSSPVSADMQNMSHAPSEIPQKQIPSVCHGITNDVAPPTSCDVSIVDKLMTGYDTSTATDMMDNGPSMAMDTGSSPVSADMQNMSHAPSEIPQKQIPSVCHGITNDVVPPTSCDVSIVDKLMAGYDTSTATNMTDNGPPVAIDTGSLTVTTDMQSMPHVPSEITKKQVPLVCQGITNPLTSSFAFIFNEPITMNDATITSSMTMDDATSVDELSESDSLEALTDMVDAVENTPTQSAIDLSSERFARLLHRNEIVPESPVKDGPAPHIDIRNIPSTSRGISGHLSKNSNLRPRTSVYYAETSSSEDSGSEYECSDDGVDSDDSNVSFVIPLPSDGKLKSTPDTSCVVSSTRQSGEKTQSTDMLIDNGNVERTDGITIATTHNIGQRKWDKVDYCIFCNESKTKLCTHFKAKHSNEVDVIDWLQTGDNTLKLQKLRRMRNIGNHRHNCEVLRQGTGELIVTYRPSPEGIPANPDDYGPCPHCYAYYVKREMWKHHCPERVETEAKKKRTVLKDSNLLVPLLRSGQASQHLGRVLAGMKLDSVSRCVKSDNLIIDVAERECFKLGHNVEQDSYVRGKLRELGRLLLQLRETFGNPDGRLEDFIYPEKFKTVILAVRDMCGFNDQSHVYSTPSLALKVGHTLKKVATVLKGRGLENGDDSLYRRASAFHDLCEMRWTEEVSSHALRTLYSRKRNNAQILPLTADITSLANYTKKVASEQMSILNNDQNGDIQAAWVTLAEMSLTRIITFNRRRQGEASKMKLCDYTSSCSTGVQETALEETLTDFEKALCKSLSRIEIVGKRGNTVPVILTADMKQQIDMLNAKRDKVGISQDNPYIFARAYKGSNSHIRGSDCLRKTAELCGAKQPQSLRSTKLRKHIATVSQVLHLNENELEVLAKFMGHDIRTHKAYYRLPDETMQLAKMSKFLLSLEKPGSLTALAGKSWKDMEIHECEEAEEDTVLDDSDLDAIESDGAEENPLVAEDHESGDQSVPDSTTHNAGSPDVPVRKRRPWSCEEKEAILRHLSRHMLLGRLPGKREIEQAIRQERALSSRSWRNVKDFCRNQMVSKAKRK